MNGAQFMLIPKMDGKSMAINLAHVVGFNEIEAEVGDNAIEIVFVGDADSLITDRITVKEVMDALRGGPKP